jgi:predicted N-acetyltransferase YhbS
MTDADAATLIPLAEIDSAEVHRVLDAAFGPDRHKRTAYKIRKGAECLAGLCFAALDGAGELVGTIQAFPVALTADGGAATPLIMVGPVAILPERQGQGYGHGLMAAQSQAIEAVTRDGGPALPQVLIGDAPFYGRFGFVEAPRGWRCPGPWLPERLLVRTRPGGGTLPPAGMLGPWRG